ncbi:MAG: DUF3185 family protein [Gammaproteobacteria bacterium]
MWKKSASTNKIISLALIVIGVGVGVGLALWRYQKSGGFDSHLSNALTGLYADNVMVLYISGAVSFAVDK